MNATAFVSRCVPAPVLAAIALAACETPTPPPPPPPPPIVVVVTPSNAEIEVGQTQTFTAQVTGGDDTTVRTVQWSIEPAPGAGPASIQFSGNTVTATGVAPGTASIIATGPDGVVSTAVLRVDAVPIIADTVEVSPPTANLVVGGTIQLAGVVKDDAGNVLDTETIVWSPQDPAVATVTSSGLVTGVAPGTTQILGTSGAAAGASTVTVIAALPTGRMAYAFADQPSAASYVASTSSLSSAGQPITITRLAAGQYQVQFAGLQPAAGQTEFVHVTTYGTDNAACKLASAGPQAASYDVFVNCFSPSEALTDTPFLVLLLGNDALPGRFAFGRADQPIVPFAYAPSSMHTSSGQAIQVIRDQSGIYRVSFPGLARTPGGPPELTLVGAIGTDTSRCAPNGFASTSVLPVQCVGPLATAFTMDDSPFMMVLLEQGQPGRRFAFATSTGFGSLPPEEAYTSSGGAITTTRHGPGRIDVLFAGLGRNGASGTETVQVSASTNLGSHCKVRSWQATGPDLLARVECYDFTGLPADSEFRVLVMQ